MSSVVNNEIQFVTLEFVKNHFVITDKQDDDTLLGIVQAANNELKKSIVGVVDDVAKLKETQFWSSIQSTALMYVESEIRRQINQLYNDAATVKLRYDESLAMLVNELRSVAPKRTKRELVGRDEDFEDDYFAERRFV